jgi:hypothetical protein
MNAGEVVLVSPALAVVTEEDLEEEVSDLEDTVNMQACSALLAQIHTFQQMIVNGGLEHSSLLDSQDDEDEDTLDLKFDALQRKLLSKR